MKNSLQITKFGGPEVLKMVETPSIPLFPNGIRIRVTAAGVNFADIMMRMGLYPEAPKPPFVAGYEIAGTVLEVDKSVRSFKPGDRVLAGTRFGGYTNEVVLSEYQVRKFPDQLTDREAAAIPVNFLTAWMALQEMGRVKKGDRVVIQSAAGGVGIAAIQIAATAGAHVIGLVSSKTKEPILKSLGAHDVLTYEEWESDKTESYQIILDSQGGKSLKDNFKKLAPGGRIINFGASSIVTGKTRSIGKLVNFAFHTPFFTAFKLMMENKGVFGLNMLKLFEDPVEGKPDLVGNMLNSILERFKDGSFKVVVGQTFPLAQGGEAHQALQGRSNIGKIILLP